MNTAKEITIGLAFTAFLLFAIAYSQVENKKEWRDFIVQHKCKKLGYMEGGVSLSRSIGNLSTGKTQDSINLSAPPNKDKWLCDDGVIY